MLIEFKTGNIFSFKEPVTFSLVAAKITEHQPNTFQAGKFTLLKSAVLYGANASGKSNFVKAINFMKNFIILSTQEDIKIDLENFRLNTETENKPSFFEIVFRTKDKVFRYGFEVDQTKVHSEWLFYTPNKKEVKLFERKERDFELGKDFKEGRKLEEKTRDNSLFLSVVAQFNGKLANEVKKWFLNLFFAPENLPTVPVTFKKMGEIDFKKKILNFLKIADLGIEDLEKNPIKNDEMKPGTIVFPEKGTLMELVSSHKKFDENNNFVAFEKFSFGGNESDGTKKFFLLAVILSEALDSGKVLVFDELETSLHPLLLESIIKTFNSEHNTKNAQLIFTTHNTNFLTGEFFRRDQVWFTEKNKFEATKLFSLVEFKERKDASFDKNYLSGRYGAIPFLGEFEKFFPEDKNV
ncbi:ATP-binding protein [bacterium]|nr:ATP-binding protein [bacterium]